MQDVMPHMDYGDEGPAIAKPFRAVLRQLVETAQTLLEEKGGRSYAGMHASMIEHIACMMVRCTSCILAVDSTGTLM